MDFADRLQLRRRIREIVEPTIERLGCTLVAVEFTGDRRGPILRLYLDRPGGIGVDDCKRVTHAVSPELDVEDPIEGSYNLEVSSPGMDRPVERRRDFEQFRGYRAKVRLGPGSERRRYTGTLGGIEDDDVLIDVDGTTFRLPFDRIDRVRLVLDLDEYLRMGQALPES